MERWRNIQGFPGYKVSNRGRIKSISRKIYRRYSSNLLLKLYFTKKKYVYVRLYKNARCTEKVIHRLVAKAFIPNPLNLPQVNHLDGDKSNNNDWNLEWTDNSGNQLHAYKLGLQPSRIGESNGRAKMTIRKVIELKTLYNKGMKVGKLTKFFNIPLHIVTDIIQGRTWKCEKTIQIIKRIKNQNEKTTLFVNPAG